MNLNEAVKALRGSNADVVAAATRAWGNPGRQVALAQVALGKGSKRLIEDCLLDAGIDVGQCLTDLGVPYSQLGLHAVAQRVLDTVGIQGVAP